MLCYVYCRRLLAIVANGGVGIGLKGQTAMANFLENGNIMQ